MNHFMAEETILFLYVCVCVACVRFTLFFFPLKFVCSMCTLNWKMLLCASLDTFIRTNKRNFRWVDVWIEQRSSFYMKKPVSPSLSQNLISPLLSYSQREPEGLYPRNLNTFEYLTKNMTSIVHSDLPILGFKGYSQMTSRFIFDTFDDQAKSVKCGPTLHGFRNVFFSATLLFSILSNCQFICYLTAIVKASHNQTLATNSERRAWRPTFSLNVTQFMYDQTGMT